jgi:hypothetical protein
MFDAIYTDVTPTLGAPPDVDSEARIYVLLTDIRDNYTHDPMATSFVHAYFDPTNEQAGTYSNGHEIIYLDIGQQSPTSGEARRALAHELARMINWGVDPGEDAWLVEGTGYLAERLNGMPHRPEVGNYLAEPEDALTGWTGSREDTGSTYLYFLYLYEQYGGNAIRQIVADSERGLYSTSSTVGEDTGSLFRRWALANYLDQSSDPYRYASLDIVSSGANNTTRFLRPPSTAVSRPADGKTINITGLLPYQGVSYYRIAGAQEDYAAVSIDRRPDEIWGDRLVDGYGAGWTKNSSVLTENLLRYSVTPVLTDDTFLLPVAPARHRGAVDYDYEIRGAYQTFLPVVMKN